MLCVLNTDGFDEVFYRDASAAEKKIFISDKADRGSAPSVYGRLLLGYMLKKYCGADSFSYRYGEKGKPCLASGDARFSISHSGGCVLCCISDKEIGCDIERVKEYNPKVAARFFTEKENLILEGSDCPSALFTKLWTLKESILKRDGTGISGGLGSYCFADYVHSSEFSAYGSYFYSVSYGEYMISVCSEYPSQELLTVTEGDIEQYINNLKKT